MLQSTGFEEHDNVDNEPVERPEVPADGSHDFGVVAPIPASGGRPAELVTR
jgi:hypothetical protein